MLMNSLPAPNIIQVIGEKIMLKICSIFLSLDIFRYSTPMTYNGGNIIHNKGCKVISNLMRVLLSSSFEVLSIIDSILCLFDLIEDTAVCYSSMLVESIAVFIWNYHIIYDVEKS